MKVTTKEVREVAENLDWIVRVYKKDNPEPTRDWRTYEQRALYRLKNAISWFEPLIDEAVSSLHISNASNAGRKPDLTLNQKMKLLLIKHLSGKSNREMSAMLALFGMLSGIDVSYRTVGRLYSDETVVLALHNLHALVLRKKGVKSSDASGDGTGYTLTIKKHYATEVDNLRENAKDSDRVKMANKSGKRMFVYSFALMDFGTRMYVAFGTSFRSERNAYDRAMLMAGEMNIPLRSVRLDRYYSAQRYAKELGRMFPGVVLYLIPKKNATVKGPWIWKRTLERFAHDVAGYLREYFQRNQSESGFSEDKRRFGWKIMQRKPDTINTAQFLTVIWHNLFWLGD